MATYKVTVNTLSVEATADREVRKWTASDWYFYLDAKDEHQARELAVDILDPDEVISTIETVNRDWRVIP